MGWCRGRGCRGCVVGAVSKATSSWKGGGRARRAVGPEPWWAVVDSSTEDGVGGAVKLEEALRAFAVEVDGAEGDGQLRWQMSWGI